jgi:heptosyltransferase II
MAMVASQVAKMCQWTLNAVLPDGHEVIPTTTLPRKLHAVAIIVPFFIGDTVLSTVLIQHLSQYCSPRTKIYIIAPSHQLNLLETLPGITERVEMPKSLSEKQRLLERLHCDAVFLLRYSLPWAISMRDAGVHYRIGFNLERFGLEKARQWGGLLTHTAPSGQFDVPQHQLEFYRTMLEILGIPWDETFQPQIQLSGQDRETASSWLETLSSPRVLLHMSAGSPGKHWPMANWSKIIGILHRQYKAHFIALGNSKDASLYNELSMESGLSIMNLCGRTTLRESAAICQQTDLIITLDTAIAHIAAAVEAPRLMVLYGPTNVDQWRPVVTDKTRLEQAYIHVNCRPCLTRTCYHKSCIRFLTPERVLCHIDRIMS